MGEISLENPTQENARKYLENLFAKAGKHDRRYKTPEEELQHLALDGARRFKKHALGFLHNTTIKSLDELAELLLMNNMAPTAEEAQEIISRIIEANALVPRAIKLNDLGSDKYLFFEKINNSDKTNSYRVSIWQTYKKHF